MFVRECSKARQPHTPSIAEAVVHAQRARAPVGLLGQPLRPPFGGDAHRVVAARARGGLVDVVVRHLAVGRVDDLRTAEACLCQLKNGVSKAAHAATIILEAVYYFSGTRRWTPVFAEAGAQVL